MRNGWKTSNLGCPILRSFPAKGRKPRTLPRPPIQNPPKNQPPPILPPTLSNHLPPLPGPVQTPEINRFSTTSTALLLMQKRSCGKLLAFCSHVTTAVASRIFVGLVFAIVHPGPQRNLPGLLPSMQVFPVPQSFTNRRRFRARAHGVYRHGVVCLLHR